MVSEIELRVMQAADKLDKIRAAFPEISDAEMRSKANVLLKILGVEEYEIREIAIRDSFGY